MLTNLAGEFVIISENTFEKLLNYMLDTSSDDFYNLESKQFVVRGDTETAINLLAIKLRSRKSFLREFTSLHMIVLTIGCNCKCDYCQASSKSDITPQAHMTIETAKRVVEIILQTPSPSIKIEFQGGEPTLNWDVLEFIVKYALKINKKKKNIDFIVCTNMVALSDQMLDFYRKYNIKISSSLDGPQHVHDRYRTCNNGNSSYEAFCNNLGKARNILGPDGCSPLLTITKNHLPHLREIVDEYVRLGFDGIFLRPVNPYGFATEDWGKFSFSTEEFISAYVEILSYILEINRNGRYFMEFYTMLLLTRILTPFSTGFVDLQSPTGAGIGGVIYDYNGEVYPTDEARMLARIGNKRFLLGNVKENSYKEIFNNNLLRKLVKHSILERMPGCSDCAYQYFCGSDPIRYYVECGDITGIRPFSHFCQKNKAIFDHIFQIIDNNDLSTMNIFWSWITNQSLEEQLL